MAEHNYAFQKEIENTAKAVGRNLDISPKQAIEICTYVRGRPVAQAKMLLEQSINEIRPVPIKRFSNGVGHKPGMSAGRYYPKACRAILDVIKSAEANAKNKGYNSSDLKLIHIAMQVGPRNWHAGRQRRSIFKNSHVEVVVAEVKGLAKNKSQAKANAKDAKSGVEKTSKKTVKKDN
jgi:large subunit ribosomal protein L22